MPVPTKQRQKASQRGVKTDAQGSGVREPSKARLITCNTKKVKAKRQSENTAMVKWLCHYILVLHVGEGCNTLLMSANFSKHALFISWALSLVFDHAYVHMHLGSPGLTIHMHTPSHILFAGSFSRVYHHFAMLVNKLHLLFFTEITDEFALRLDVHGFLRYVDIISIHSIASWNVIHIYQCCIFVKLYRLS